MIDALMTEANVRKAGCCCSICSYLPMAALGRKLRRTWKIFALAAFVAAYLVPNGLDVQID